MHARYTLFPLVNRAHRGPIAVDVVHSYSRSLFRPVLGVSVFISSIRLPFRISETTLRHLKMNLHFIFRCGIVRIGAYQPNGKKTRTREKYVFLWRWYSASTKSDKINTLKQKKNEETLLYIDNQKYTHTQSYPMHKTHIVRRATSYAEQHITLWFRAHVYGSQMMTILTSLYIIINPLL